MRRKVDHLIEPLLKGASERIAEDIIRSKEGFNARGIPISGIALRGMWDTAHQSVRREVINVLEKAALMRLDPAEWDVISERIEKFINLEFRAVESRFPPGYRYEDLRLMDSRVELWRNETIGELRVFVEGRKKALKESKEKMIREWVIGIGGVLLGVLLSWRLGMLR